MGTLTVHFRGICTHFWNNAIPGIPHRVVLPDAAPLRAGLVSFAESSDPTQSFSYFLLPHLPLVTMDGQSFDQSGIVDDGVLMKGNHLRIVNAIDTGLSYDPSFSDLVPQLTTFLSDYSPSADVVTGARASAYFDIFSGKISAFKDGEDVRVQADIETDGPPALRMTSMTASDTSVSTVEFKLQLGDKPTLPTLRIGNVSPFCLDGCDYDFLLHYLTDVTGIPRVLTRRGPGMPDGAGSGPDPVESLKKLIKWGFPVSLIIEELLLLELFETSASCSDSRYP